MCAEHSEAVVAVLGAAGFVGATLVERLRARARYEVVPCIHSTGNAWRLSRHGLKLVQVDVRNAQQVDDALRGCTHVVNCVSGPPDVMLEGLENVLRAARAHGVERYVHLGSISVYGDRETGSTLDANSQPNDALTDYGRMKLAQDKLVQSTHTQGLPSVILTPPYISGAYSPFVVRMVDALRNGRLALVDDGALPCSLIDVENLAAAIELALERPRPDARRILVTDDDPITWADLARGLAPLAGNAAPPESISSAEVRELSATPPRKASLLGTVRTLGSVLGSADARARWKADPLVAGLYEFARDRMPGALTQRLRRHAPAGPAGTIQSGAAIDTHLLAVQLRATRQSVDLAREWLGFDPPLDSGASLAAFSAWYRTTHGISTAAGSRLQVL